MLRAFSPSHVLACAFAVVLCGYAASAQTNSNPLAETATPVGAAPVQRAPQPFAVNAPSGDVSRLVEFRPAEEMTERDRLLAANAESSIAEHAGLNGFALDQPNWSYEQIVCTALPNHLFLRYKRNNGVGDVTVFTASVPRNGDGRVRIVPILKRGYSLFSPAPINAMTVSAFNHIRAEEPETVRRKGWLGNAMCYAALAGAHPKLTMPGEEPEAGKPVPAMTPMMRAEVNGGEVIQFVDEAAPRRPMEWTMIFAKHGKLTKATHVAAEMTHERPVPEISPKTSKERPVPIQDEN